MKQLHKGEAIGYGFTYKATKEMQIATVTIGYGDGIPRELSNRTGFNFISEIIVSLGELKTP